MSRLAPHAFHGLEIPLRVLSGARALRIVHPACQRIAEHRHDWPLLTFLALGGYEEDCDDGRTPVCGPAAVLHPAGRCHANCIHDYGMETVSIEFDPGWVAVNRALLDRSHYWIGGSIPLASRALVQLWIDPETSEAQLRSATAEFLHFALLQGPAPSPPWLESVQHAINAMDRPTASAIADRIGLHPRWLAHAYRQAVGEGLRDTLLRTRCERAAHLLRSTSSPIAEVAFASGFCDQSHLNRALRQLTGRTPVQLRKEGERLATIFAY